MEELTMNSDLSISNKELNLVSKSIELSMISAEYGIIKTCFLFGRIQKEALWKKDTQFGSFEDYCKKVFGLGRASAFKYAKIGCDYVEEVVTVKGKKKIVEYVLKGGWRNVSQVSKLLPYDNAKYGTKLQDYIKNGIVTPDMSTREIEEELKNIKEKNATKNKSLSAIPKDGKKKVTAETAYSGYLVARQAIIDTLKETFNVLKFSDDARSVVLTNLFEDIMVKSGYKKGLKQLFSDSDAYKKKHPDIFPKGKDVKYLMADSSALPVPESDSKKK